MRCQASRGSASLKKHSSRDPELHDIGEPVAVEVDQLDVRVVDTDAGRLPVRLERAAAPTAGERHREVAGLRARGDQQVGATVAVGVDELDAGFAEPVRRCLRYRPRHSEPAVAAVRPVPRRRTQLDDVGQAPPAQVDQGHRRVAHAARRQPGAGHRLEPAPGRVEPAVAERQRRQRLELRRSGSVVDADHLDPGEQRDAVERRLLVAEPVLARRPIDTVGGVRGDPDRPAAQRRADLEPGPIVGERVGPRLIVERHAR